LKIHVSLLGNNIRFAPVAKKPQAVTRLNKSDLVQIQALYEEKRM